MTTLTGHAQGWHEKDRGTSVILSCVVFLTCLGALGPPVNPSGAKRQTRKVKRSRSAPKRHLGIVHHEPSLATRLPKEQPERKREKLPPTKGSPWGVRNSNKSTVKIKPSQTVQTVIKAKNPLIKIKKTQNL